LNIIRAILKQKNAGYLTKKALKDIRSKIKTDSRVKSRKAIKKAAERLYGSKNQ